MCFSARNFTCELYFSPQVLPRPPPTMAAVDPLPADGPSVTLTIRLIMQGKVSTKIFFFFYINSSGFCFFMKEITPFDIFTPPVKSVVASNSHKFLNTS